MSDIFISYANSDRDRILPLVEVLEKEGWSVWWDRLIPVGKSFDEIIEAEINSAKCIIVIWSNNSVQSRWVKTEASEGAERGVLFPVIFDNVKIPFEFRRIHAAQLSDWNGDADNQALAELLNSLASIIGTRATQNSTKHKRDANQGGHLEEMPTGVSGILEQAKPVESDDKKINPASDVHTPMSHSTDPHPTGIMDSALNSEASIQLPQNEKSGPVTPPVAAPTQMRSPQKAARPFSSQFDLSVARKRWIRLVCIAIPSVLLLVIFGSYFFRSSAQCPIITVNCQPSGDQKSFCYIRVEEIGTSPGNYSQDAGQLLSSLHALAALQTLPRTVTNVSWDISSGSMKAHTDQGITSAITIDTTGLSGREITATATVRGYGWVCSNTASNSFVAK